MSRPGPQQITFVVPEVFITVSVADAMRIVAELRRYAREELRPERLRVAEILEQTVAGVKGTQRLVVADLPEEEQAALFRAVEHLRWASDRMSAELRRLHGALKGWVPLPQISYEVAYGYGGTTTSFTSYSGRYEVGDRLPPTRQDECWEAILVDAGALKGMNDAIALGEALKTHKSLEEALTQWDKAQTDIDNNLVRFGNQLGQALVTEIPDWSKMDATSMEKWFTSIVTIQTEMLDPNTRKT